MRELLNGAEWCVCVCVCVRACLHVFLCNTQNYVTQLMHRCTHLLVEHLSDVQI